MTWSPASCSASMVQSIQASAPSSTGDSLTDGDQPMPWNLSAPLVAITRQSSSWSSPRMFTQNLPARSMRGHVVLAYAAQNATSGGSSDTDVNEFAARPTGSPPSGSTAVMTVTPVAKWPSTDRYRAASTVGYSGSGSGPGGSSHD